MRRVRGTNSEVPHSVGIKTRREGIETSVQLALATFSHVGIKTRREGIETSCPRVVAEHEVVGIKTRREGIETLSST